MIEKIYEKNKNLIIEIPLEQTRYNPYDDDADPNYKGFIGPNILGLIEGEECGFCYLIDMSYKGKADQWTNMFFTFSGSPDDFRKLCKELKIDYYEQPMCFDCGKPLYGSFTVNRKGKPIHHNCKD